MKRIGGGVVILLVTATVAHAAFAIFMTSRPATTGSLLLESGDFILLEDGSKLLLE